jgi:hypothetical protein
MLDTPLFRSFASLPVASVVGSCQAGSRRRLEENEGVDPVCDVSTIRLAQVAQGRIELPCKCNMSSLVKENGADSRTPR